MKIVLKVEEKEFDVKYLEAMAGARYWEDSTVNGVEDTDGTLIPCREGDYWHPIIELETGIITNWEKGKVYKLLDENKNVIKTIEGYVPDMSPKENGYGDYVIMDVDADGKILDWAPMLSEFEDNED